MKKLYLPMLVFCGLMQTQAQELNPTDAIKIGMPQINGSARFNAMGGAFGALGGDVSAIQINPAGSALYNYNNFSFTGSLQLQKINLYLKPIHQMLMKATLIYLTSVLYLLLILKTRIRR